MQSLLRDIRYGMRSLLKSPGLTTVAILALTLGIGLTTTMFSIVYGVMMKGLPYPNGDRIVIVYRNNTLARHPTSRYPSADYVDYTNAALLQRTGRVHLRHHLRQRRRKSRALRRIVDYRERCSIIGVKPMLGRNFRAGEDTPKGDKSRSITYCTWKTAMRRTRTSSARVFA